MNAAILIVSLVSMWASDKLFQKAFGPTAKAGYLKPFLQSLVGYAVFVGIFAAYEWHLAAVLNAFDINRDGIFNGDEVSAAQGEAFDAYINDAGRNMFKLLAPAVFFLIAVVRSGVRWVRRRRTDEGDF